MVTVYLDHAATTPVRGEALHAMLPWFSEHFANASGSYAAAREARQAVDCARGQIAQAIGAKRGEIYFTSGGSEADNWALRGILCANPAKKHVITTMIEHHAMLRTCEALEKQGFRLTYLPVDRSGRIDPDAVERAVSEDTALISVMLANNEVGTIEPVGAIAKIAQAHGVVVHTDAVQAVGHIPVNVQTLGVDMLSMSAHKFGGPKGIGALYIRDGVRIDSLIYGGAQERNLRAGTENVPGIVGMGEALRLACLEMPDQMARVARMRDAMQEDILRRIPGAHVNAQDADRLPGHLHVTLDGADSSLLLMQLDMAGIAASAGSACSSGALERSHVLLAMGVSGVHQADIRFTLGAENTPEEIGQAVSALERIIKRSSHHT